MPDRNHAIDLLLTEEHALKQQREALQTQRDWHENQVSVARQRLTDAERSLDEHAFLQKTVGLKFGQVVAARQRLQEHEAEDALELDS